MELGCLVPRRLLVILLPYPFSIAQAFLLAGYQSTQPDYSHRFWLLRPLSVDVVGS